jgi:hypothetical protein
VLLNFDWQLQAKYDMGDMSVIPALVKEGKAFADSQDWDKVLSEK